MAVDEKMLRRGRALLDKVREEYEDKTSPYFDNDVVSWMVDDVATVDELLEILPAHGDEWVRTSYEMVLSRVCAELQLARSDGQYVLEELARRWAARRIAEHTHRVVFLLARAQGRGADLFSHSVLQVGADSWLDTSDVRCILCGDRYDNQEVVYRDTKRLLPLPEGSLYWVSADFLDLYGQCEFSIKSKKRAVVLERRRAAKLEAVAASARDLVAYLEKYERYNASGNEELPRLLQELEAMSARSSRKKQ